MRNFIIAFSILFAAFVTSKPAFAFPVQTQTFVSYYQIDSQVYNFWNRPIFCNMSIQGLTQTGTSVWAYANIVVWPGQYGYAYAYARYPFYFVGGSSFANCNWY